MTEAHDTNWMQGFPPAVPTKYVIRARDEENRGMIALDDRYLETFDICFGRIIQVKLTSRGRDFGFTPATFDFTS